MRASAKKDLTPMSYLKVFFRRKEIFIIPTFAGLILGVCAGLILPKKYESNTIILVEESKSDNPLFEQIAVSSTVLQRMTAIRESMLGWNSLMTLVQRLNLDKEVESPQELENLVLGIRNDILITMRGQNVIDLSYVGNDPQTTYSIVKNITEIFIERNVELQNEETSNAIKFIEEQLKVYLGKIKSSEIAKLRDELDALLLDATEAHPKVKKLREEIQAKEKELREKNLEYSEDEKLEKESTNPIIKEIRSALQNLEKDTVKLSAGLADPEQDFYKVMLVERMGNVMARDADVNNQIYNMLLQRLETAKITQRLQESKEGTKYTVLDPPRVPLKPVKPNKILVALIGLFIGGLVGSGMVFASEFFDKSFIDVEEANQFLGVPLLGAISKIHTNTSLRRSREKRFWMYTLMFILGFVAIVLTMAFANFLR